MEKALETKRTGVKKRVPQRIGKVIRDSWSGWLFVLPLVLGMVIFTFIPMVQSLVYCFYNYDGVMVFEFVGFQNFVRMFTVDREFPVVLGNTFLWTVISVPLNMVLSYAFALFVNLKVKGMKAFRVIYYLPVVIPGVVSGLLWKDVFNPTYGVANSFLTTLGLPASRWFEGAETAMLSLIVMNLWSVGGGMVLWLAALKAVPESLYEHAKIDGANSFVRLVAITLPMTTPTIFYNLVMQVIGALQNFSTYVIASNNGKGPDNSLYFYAVKIYNTAFSGTRFQYGYASALAWILFLIIGVLTVVLFTTCKWVYYGEES